MSGKNNGLVWLLSGPVPSGKLTASHAWKLGLWNNNRITETMVAVIPSVQFCCLWGPCISGWRWIASKCVTIFKCFITQIFVVILWMRVCHGLCLIGSIIWDMHLWVKVICIKVALLIFLCPCIALVSMDCFYPRWMEPWESLMCPSFYGIQ